MLARRLLCQSLPPRRLCDLRYSSPLLAFPSACRIGHGMPGDFVQVRLGCGKAWSSRLFIKGPGGSYRCSTDAQLRGLYIIVDVVMGLPRG